ncbi:GNAT family N-acetyltransferase [Kineococcus indalonis]|uniref:GNAT family N-acetyltransferase n=1 Tax=Kineococcus indalonis TaxID=2696566 RepID=UPI0014132E60|nr:GNAT family N-acetyltransferase [Kineococcus indalonis]
MREAGPADGEAVAQLVRELAEYEREPRAATATGEDFARALEPGSGVGCLLAEVDGPDGVEVAGMALWYTTFSTWQGRRGMWLEDLFVRPQHRRRGIARSFFARMGQLCAERGYGRLEWWVLDWNTPAHGFYRSLGAAPEEGWTTWRLDGERLAALAPRATGSAP